MLPAEKAIFESLLPVIGKQKVLDIGIGGGRTTGYLLDAVGEYTGIDYLPQFAAEVSSKFPDANILCSDATDLKEFENDSFDFILFSYNGIDSLSHEKRLKAMNEIYRVLVPGGRFMFSSHNRDYVYFNRLPWRRRVEFNTRYFKFLLYSLYHLPKHFEMKKYEVFETDYAIVNDCDHRYGLLYYYISIEKQRRQLEDRGFSDVTAFDVDGSQSISDVNSPFIHYLAIKPLG